MQPTVPFAAIPAAIVMTLIAATAGGVDSESLLQVFDTCDGPIQLSLERFHVVAPGAIVTTVGDQGLTEQHTLSRDRVQLFRGTSQDGSLDAFIAQSPEGALGLLMPRGGGNCYTLTTLASNAAPQLCTRGMRPGPWRFEREIGFSGVDSPVPCGLDGDLASGSGSGGSGGSGGASGSLAGVGAVWPKMIELAVDTDFEFCSIFASPQAAEDYIVALYGINSLILTRDTGVRLSLTYLRLWDTAADLFNEPDPLDPFRSHWNDQQGNVPRDLAQLLTGRRNLPYGGVAWLNAVCTGSGYSVSGYMNGSFADGTADNPGNWDINVSTHEIGHNIGTLHTHSYGLDACNTGEVRRAGLMSYCHTVSGASANVDLRFETLLAQQIQAYVSGVACIDTDCDEDGIDDSTAISSGAVFDNNLDGIPDSCQDCDGDGVLDPQEILQGEPDVDGNSRPDHCDPDCNSNSIPDAMEIAAALVTDTYLNGVPDECEVDCDSSGTSDYTQINTVGWMINDRSRDGRLDSCEDCDADGVTDAEELNGALGIWCVQAGGDLVYELHGRSGVRVRSTPTSLISTTDITIGPDGALYAAGTISVTGARLGAITRLDRSTGNLEFFVSPNALLGTDISALCWRADGAMLVVSRSRKAVVEFSATGAPPSDLVPPSAGLIDPRRCRATESGELLVLDGNSLIRRFDATTGADLGSIGASLPLDVGVVTDIETHPDGRVFVSSVALDAILLLDLMTGAYGGRFDVGPNPSSSVALRDPTAMKLGPRGDVLLVCATGTSASVHGFRLSDGYYLRTYRVYSVDAPQPTSMAVVGASLLDIDMDFLLDECDPTPPVPADLNGDGIVDGADLAIMLLLWGQLPGNPNADLNGDGTVGGGDLPLLLASWR